MSEFLDVSQSLQARKFPHTRRMNRAFIVEALVLLVFIAASIALLIQLFVAAGMQSVQAHDLSMSTRLAADAAETFSASPTAGTATARFDADGNELSADASDSAAAWTVTTNVTSAKQSTGVLYKADITVAAKDGSTYDVATERYVSGKTGGAQ